MRREENWKRELFPQIRAKRSHFLIQYLSWRTDGSLTQIWMWKKRTLFIPFPSCPIHFGLNIAALPPPFVAVALNEMKNALFVYRFAYKNCSFQNVNCPWCGSVATQLTVYETKMSLLIAELSWGIVCTGECVGLTISSSEVYRDPEGREVDSLFTASYQSMAFRSLWKFLVRRFTFKTVCFGVLVLAFVFATRRLAGAPFSSLLIVARRTAFYLILRTK